MKWITKKAAVIDETVRYSTDDKKEAHREKQRRRYMRKKTGNADSENLRSFVALSGFSRRRACELLNITKSRMNGILYQGVKLSVTESKIINAKLIEEDVEIKKNLRF